MGHQNGPGKFTKKTKKGQIGDNLVGELMIMEHTVKEGGRFVMLSKAIPCTYVDNLAEEIETFVDENAK